jgi:hypothetical protein
MLTVCEGIARTFNDLRSRKSEAAWHNRRYSQRNLYLTSCGSEARPRWSSQAVNLEKG